MQEDKTTNPFKDILSIIDDLLQIRDKVSKNEKEVIEESIASLRGVIGKIDIRVV